MERRLVVRMLKYWRSLIENGARRPGMNRINPETLADSWDWCYALDFSESEDDPIIRFAGHGYFDDLDSDPVGCRLSEINSVSLLRYATTYFPDAVRKAVPVTFGGEFNGEDGTRTLYRSVILPLDDENGTFSILFGATNYRRDSA